MPRLAGSRGSCSAPASPARNAPSANTAVNSRAWSMPSAAVSVRFSLAARISTPKRVRVTSSVSADEHERPDRDQEQVVLRDRAPEELERAGEARRARSEQVGRRRRSRAPRRARSARRANVAVSCRSSGAAYRRFSSSTSISAPMSATASAASSTPSQNDAAPRPNVAARSSPAAYAQYAPSMYSEPCAKLTMRVTPKISVRPGGDEEQRGRRRQPVEELQQERGKSHWRSLQAAHRAIGSRAGCDATRH